MKTTNIFHKLKASGAYNTDGMKPQLPGLQSPLKKSPYNFNAGLKKAAAEGKLDDNPGFKNAVESSPAKKGCSPTKLVPEEVEGRKPKTRRNKAQKGVNKMLGGLANANRGCKPHRKIKSR